MDDTPDKQPDQQAPRIVEAREQLQQSSGSGKKRALMGVAGLSVVCLVAGATYGLLTVYMPRETASVQPTATTQTVDTPETIDSIIQSDITAEQKIDDQLSDEESQTILDEANSAESLEGNYANL